MSRTLFLALLLSTSASAQTTWYVDLTATPPGSGTQLAPYASINFALQRPSTLSGDTVLVAPGTYLENVSFPGRGVSLISTNGAAVTTIDAGGSGSAVSLLSTDGSTMLLSGFTITGGTGTSAGGNDQGGGIFASGCIAKVRKCIVENNTAFEGGGVYAENSDFDMRTSTVRNNAAVGIAPTGGGLMFVGGTGVLRRTIVRFNDAGLGAQLGFGGGIFATGPLSIQRCSITDNTANAGGGGVYGSDDIAGCRIARNVGHYGGGLFFPGVVRNSSIIGNLADDNAGGTDHRGGGVYAGLSTDVRDCYLAANVALGAGGAAYGGKYSRCTIVDNEANDAESLRAEGGGVWSGGYTNCTLISNVATATGSAQGGGAYGGTLIDCVLSGNDARSSLNPAFAFGGGAYNSNLIRSQVSGNTTNGFGGGAYRGTATSTEFFENSAGWGGGVSNARLDRSVVFNNNALTAGGGVYDKGGRSGISSIRNSIVWLNSTSEIEVGTGSNLGVYYTDVLGAWSGNGNIDEDPLFWNQSANDFHLQADSPCINAGDPLSTLDPDGSRADMGAYPFDPNYQG